MVFMPNLSASATQPGGGGGGGGTRIWKGRGYSSEIGPSFFGPQKETMLKHRQMKNTVTFNDGKDMIIENVYP